VKLRVFVSSWQKKSPQRHKDAKKHEELFSLFFFVNLRVLVSSWQKNRHKDEGTKKYEELFFFSFL
jgi:hypothetical protein